MLRLFIVPKSSHQIDNDNYRITVLNASQNKFMWQLMICVLNIVKLCYHSMQLILTYYLFECV